MKNPYFIASGMVFLLLFFVGRWLGFSWEVSALASAALVVIGLGAMMWLYKDR